jgi:hypothetical protein
LYCLHSQLIGLVGKPACLIFSARSVLGGGRIARSNMMFRGLLIRRLDRRSPALTRPARQLGMERGDLGQAHPDRRRGRRSAKRLNEIARLSDSLRDATGGHGHTAVVEEGLAAFFGREFGGHDAAAQAYRGEWRRDGRAAGVRRLATDHPQHALS